MAALWMPIARQLFRQAVCSVLGAREHQHLAPVLRADQERQQLALALAIHRVHDLCDQFAGGIALCDLDLCRIVQQAVGQLPDLVGEGGGEQQVLALLGQQCEDFADIADETHIQHAVGFVEDQDFDPGKIQHVLPDQVQQAARCGHQDIDAAAQGRDLRVDADAAVDLGAFQRQVFAVGVHARPDLGREFARRGQHDQRTYRTVFAGGRRLATGVATAAG